MRPTETPNTPQRPRVTNERWDPAVMLAKARAGAYPTAKSKRPSRDMPGMTEAEAEVAYWTQRCGLPLDLPADELDAPAAHAHSHDADLDAQFAALGPTKQRGIIRSYLSSTQDADQERGAHLCAMAGLDVHQERRAAERAIALSIGQAQQRLRAEPSRKERAQAGQGVMQW